MSKHDGYDLLQERFVKEINSNVSFFRHRKTGAEILSIENNDENKVFGITFRTPPPDSSGLPHIMEHSVLCGSRKYQVKEPFVELMKGSLNTFLNAFTYPDKTCYPVASTNEKDFYNLVDVYLDSVFFPLLSPYTLMQEGWHYELDPLTGDMSYKGVVFNEMKGAFSSPDDILGDESQMSVFPDTPYGLHSGGDPEMIINLNYEQFKQYHDLYYHPSNARIYFYGNDDVNARFAKMDEYLNQFDLKVVESGIPLQTRFSEPTRKVIPYDSGESGSAAKAYVLMNWMLREGDDVLEKLRLSILSYILVANPASPLKKALSESGLGEDVIGRGLESELRQLSFATGLRGVEVENVAKVEQLILSELESIRDKGIDPKTIEAAINTIEFRLRENNTGSFPRGLLIMLRSLTNWLYDLDPITPLEFQAALEQIKQEIKTDHKFFETLIQSYLLDNPHRVSVVLVPDENLGKIREENEKARITAARQKMSEDEINLIIANGLELKRRQETADSPENLASIPMLTLEDLDPQVNTIPIEVLETQSGLILYHDLFTSDILYLDLAFNLHDLPMEYIPYLSLFSSSLLEMGTENEDFVSLIQRIGRETGGINASVYISDQYKNDQALVLLLIRAKAITGQLQELLSILKDIIFHPNFENKERFRQMVLEEKSSLEAGIIPSGHRVVNNRLKSHFSEAAWLTEQTGGLDYLDFIRSLAERLDQEWESVQKAMAFIRRFIFSRENLTVNATIDQPHKDTLLANLQAFMQQFPLQTVDPVHRPKQKINYNEGLTIPSQVNFVAKGANLYHLGYDYHGSINVITSYLKSTWLWEKIRVQGGAYGGFITFDRLSGLLTFLSYRDPNLIETISIYDQTAEFLRSFQISEDELNKSIIGAIGDLQAYMLPDAKGFTSLIRHLLHITDRDRQIIRDQVLATSKSDFSNLAPYLDKVRESGHVVVLGSAQALQSINQKIPEFLTIKKII